MTWDEEPRLVRVLTGWKSIADFLERSLTWTKDAGIPVYTLGTGPNARVCIDEPDLLAWVEARKKETTR